MTEKLLRMTGGVQDDRNELRQRWKLVAHTCFLNMKETAFESTGESKAVSKRVLRRVR